MHPNFRYRNSARYTIGITSWTFVGFFICLGLHPHADLLVKFASLLATMLFTGIATSSLKALEYTTNSTYLGYFSSGLAIIAGLAIGTETTHPYQFRPTTHTVIQVCLILSVILILCGILFTKSPAEITKQKLKGDPQWKKILAR